MKEDHTHYQFLYYVFSQNVHVQLTVWCAGGTCIVRMCAGSGDIARWAVYKSGLVPSTTEVAEGNGAIAWTKRCTRLCCGI